MSKPSEKSVFAFGGCKARWVSVGSRRTRVDDGLTGWGQLLRKERAFVKWMGTEQGG